MNSDIVWKSLSAPIPRPAWPKGLPQKIWDEQKGACYHCKIQLPPRDETPRKYDLDHHPIPYRDIVDNACPSFCVKVEDNIERTNLVAAHAVCNRSHQHEATSHSCCNRTQCFCPKRRSCFGLWIVGTLCVGIGIGITISYLFDLKT